MEEPLKPQIYCLEGNVWWAMDVEFYHVHIFFNFADCKIDNNKTSVVDNQASTQMKPDVFTKKPLKDKNPKSISNSSLK